MNSPVAGPMGDPVGRGARRLQWDGCVNVRDLGGYPSRDGGRTRFGSVVRSDNPARLTPKAGKAPGLRHPNGDRTADRRSR